MLHLMYKLNILLILENKEINFVLSLHYNGSGSYLFVNGVKIYQFKAKDSQLNRYPLYLGIISNNFTVNNMNKNWTIWICVSFFC